MYFKTESDNEVNLNFSKLDPHWCCTQAPLKYISVLKNYSMVTEAWLSNQLSRRLGLYRRSTWATLQEVKDTCDFFHQRNLEGHFLFTR